MATAHTALNELLEVIESRRSSMDRLTKHWQGKAPASFLNKKSRDQLDKSLSTLGVNMPRLVVTSLVDRLQVAGFRAAGNTEQDDTLRRLWKLAGLTAKSELVHTDRALYGAAYVTVWSAAGNSRRPVVMTDSPYGMATDTDPATGEVRSAVRRWKDKRGVHAVLFTPNRTTRFHSTYEQAAAGTGWKMQETTEHGLGVVPVVPFIRQTSSGDSDGTSAVADILDLTDALAKIMQDAMVTSEDYARPRRWATGLEIEENEDGTVVDPFGQGKNLHSEDPETKFGQFDAARLTSYTDMTATLTQQIGALTGLPPHYLGLHGDQPANADSVRASEAQLTSRAYSEQRHLSEPWANVAALLAAVAGAQDPLDFDYEPVWNSPEIRTPAQAADSAAKLAGIGVPLRSLLHEPLDYEPHQIEAIMANRQGEAVQQAALRRQVTP